MISRLKHVCNIQKPVQINYFVIKYKLEKSNGFKRGKKSMKKKVLGWLITGAIIQICLFVIVKLVDFLITFSVS